MAHQAHNISYSKYLALFDKSKKEALRGSNHKNINFEEAKVLSHEFIQVIKEFAETIVTKIKQSKPYTEKEYIVLMGSNTELHNIANTNFYFWHLCNAVTTGDPRLFATVLKYMRKSNQPVSTYNYYYPGAGQSYLGGLAQVFDSFLRAYILINTLVNAGYKCNEFWNYFEKTSKSNKIYTFFINAFEFGCNSISDEFQKKYNSIYGKMPNIYHYYIHDEQLEEYRIGIKTPNLPDNVSLDELREISKEMFRLMYTTYAILSIDNKCEKDEENEIKVMDTIKSIIENEIF